MKFPVRKKIWTGDAANAQDVGNLARDVGNAISSQIPFSKASVTGYPPSTVAGAVKTLSIAVDTAPFAIICARIRIAGDLQNTTTAPQGGFCEFAYDAGAGKATITHVNAWSVNGGVFSVSVQYVMDFLVVY